jgi:hypothetical protein
MFPRFHGPDRQWGMEIVGRRQHNQINQRIGDDFVKAAVRLATPFLLDLGAFLRTAGRYPV